jgi:UDP-glucose 4-epimerase
VIDQAPITHDYTTDYRQADALDLPTLTDALSGTDAVIHLAAVRSPNSSSPETVFRTNALSTYHVTLACEKLGITRIIYASSICYYGYIFRSTLVSPPYFPVDEGSTSYPEDSYSLSKRVGEKIMSTFVQRTGGSVVSLRYAYLTSGGATGEQLSEDGTLEYGTDEVTAQTWWTYVDMNDAATATWQSLEYIAPRANLLTAFNIGADDTHSNTPTHALLERYFADSMMRFPNPLEPQSYTTLYSNVKARQLLGFRPTPSTWRTLVRSK